MGVIRHNLPTIIVLTLIFGVTGCVVLLMFLWHWVGLARAALFAAMFAWTGVLLSFTIVPRRRFRGAGLPRTCDVTVLPRHITGALTNERRLLALLLFVPLAILLILAARGLQRYLLAGVLLALPLLVEGVQYLLPGLHRPCSTNDVYDAWLGLFAGVALGAAALPVIRRSRLFQPVRGRHHDPSSRPKAGDLVRLLWPPYEESADKEPALPTFVPSGVRPPPPARPDQPPELRRPAPRHERPPRSEDRKS
jgi:hypothetical protein